MQTPQYAVGGLIFQALPACLAGHAVPGPLRAWAEWCIVAYPAGSRLGHPEVIAGWLAPIIPAGAKGDGGLACYTGGGSFYGPDLAYLTQAGSSRQGTRFIAEATAASVTPRLFPGAALAVAPPLRPARRRRQRAGRRPR